MRCGLALILVFAVLVPGAEAADRDRVGQTPQDWRLDAFYKKHVSVRGFPVLSSDAVSDFGLLEAAYLIGKMTETRPDILKALIANRVRFAVMGISEMTTDIPEHSDLTPARYWDVRARGLGATRVRPVVSCGEENLLGYPGDPYATENILIHEFAHAMHEMGLNSIDPTFEERLKSAYDSALRRGLWKGKYASTNRAEYWAEGVQSWFDTNRENDHDHNHVNTREELEEYDPDLAELIASVFGRPEWRYVPPARRTSRDHLAGYDPAVAPTFRWDPELLQWYHEYEQDRARRSGPGPRTTENKASGP